MQSKQHICGGFPSLNIIYGSGRNSSFVIQKLIMQHFHVFQKINLQNFSITRNKINSSSDLLISYPSITQTQIKHMLSTSFNFRVNSYIKIVVSKTQENSRLKSRYLKGITTEQLFIISIIGDYPQSPFIQLLKNRKLDTHFLFCFLMKQTHLVVKPKGKKYLARYMEDVPPPSWMLEWSNAEVE